MSSGPSGRAGPLPVRVRARRVWRRVRRAARRAAAARDRAESARRPSPTSSIAAPRAPIRARATVPGILMQIPDAFFRAVVAEELPAAGPLRRRDVLLPPRGRAPARARAAARRRSSRTRARASSAGATSRSTRRSPGRTAAAVRTSRPAARRRRRRMRLADQDAFERKLYVIRRRFELEGGADAIIPSFSSRTIVYKGMLTAPQLRGYYPDLQDERTAIGARARPLAVLDEHVPELGARPPVPDDRPQRRDQHRAREHQLDARARVAARVRAVRRRPPQGAAARPGGRIGLGRRSTTCSSCSCSAAARCRTR